MLTRSFIIAALFLLVGFVYVSHLHFSDTTENFTGKKRVVELKRDQPISQQLTAHDNSLQGVKVAMRSGELWLGESLTLSVLDASCHTVIQTTTLRLLGPYRHGAFVHFAFPPIKESLGQTFCVSLKYRSPYDGRKDRPTILAVSHESTRDETKRLQIRLVYGEPTLTERASRLEERISYFAPDFLREDHLKLGLIACLVSYSLLVWIWRNDGHTAVTDEH